MSQPVLVLLPADARSIGPSVGLLESAEGGVVFVFVLVTFTFAVSDRVGRRLAAVQLGLSSCLCKKCWSGLVYR